MVDAVIKPTADESQHTQGLPFLDRLTCDGFSKLRLAEGSDGESGSLRDVLSAMTVSSETSDLASSRTDRLAASAKDDHGSWECSTSGRSEPDEDRVAEPLLRENAARFTMHPIRQVPGSETWPTPTSGILRLACVWAER